MSKKLLIVESPNKIKKIKSFLSDDYEVIATVGHIRDLSKSGQYGLGVDLDTMIPKYSISKKQQPVVKDLVSHISNSDDIYIATDPDREGEAIAWHVSEIIKKNIESGKIKNNVKIHRAIFNEITKEAVLNSISNSLTINQDLVSSQEARRILDRMIGFRLSKLAQMKTSARSAGRVKSSTLKMIFDREKEIQDHIVEKWWTLKGYLDKENYLYLVNPKYSEIKFKSLEEANNVYEKLSFSLNFLESKTKDVIIKAPKPLEMSSFLASMYSNYGTSNAKSSLLAQGLYEKGFITYPRTDSIRISSTNFINESFDFIKKSYGNEFLKEVNNDVSKTNTNSQDAHEAIRPTDVNVTPKNCNLSDQELKAYTLIWNTTVKSFLKDGINESKKNIYKDGENLFAIKYTSTKFKGFRIVDNNEIDHKELKLENKLNLDKSIFKVEEHATKPPARYNFASLILAMKENGIGRPSTYSPTTTGLIKFHYLINEKGSLIPTELGKETNDLMVNNFSTLVNEKYTASLETDLDKIAQGEEKKEDFLHHFWEEFSNLYDFVEKTVEKAMPKFVEDEVCDICGSALIYKIGRFGKFKACINYPECKFAKPLTEKAKPEILDKKCPECGSDLVKRISKFKKEFIGCSTFPKCKYHEF